MTQLPEGGGGAFALAEVRGEGQPPLVHALGDEEPHGLGEGQSQGLEERLGLGLDSLVDADLHGGLLAHGVLRKNFYGLPVAIFGREIAAFSHWFAKVIPVYMRKT